MLRKIKGKINSRAGLTLTEMLITLGILSLLSMACLAGITAALNARRNSIQIANADLISSTMRQVVMQEMRLSYNVRIKDNPDDAPNGKKLLYDGGSSVMNLSTRNSALYLDADGHLWRQLGTSNYKVLNDSAYSGLKASDLEFSTVEGTDRQLSCSFNIVDDSGNVIKTNEFTVRTLNSIKVKS